MYGFYIQAMNAAMKISSAPAQGTRIPSIETVTKNIDSGMSAFANVRDHNGHDCAPYGSGIISKDSLS